MIKVRHTVSIEDGITKALLSSIKLKIEIPPETIGIWSEKDYVFVLSVHPSKGTVCIHKHKYIKTLNTIYLTNRVSHIIHNLEELWNLKKPYTHYNPRSMFDMALNEVENGDLVRCV